MNEHYRLGNIQPIEAITDWNLGYNPATAVVYIARHLKKGKPEEDLKKAIWHLVYELTEDTDVCDAILDVVEENRSVEWIEEGEEESPSCLGEYADGGTRYVIHTDGIVCFDSADFGLAAQKFEAVSTKFHCSRAVFIDRGAIDGCRSRVVGEWTEDDDDDGTQGRYAVITDDALAFSSHCYPDAIAEFHRVTSSGDYSKAVLVDRGDSGADQRLVEKWGENDG